ncbi:hypothetical protein ACSBR2_011456 [Camellia fascicularis]
MGMWDLITNSSSAAVKRNAPDLSFLREACRSTYAHYGYSWSAVSKINDAVRVGVVERVNHYLPDEEGKAKIGCFAKNAAIYACHEGLKCLPLPGLPNSLPPTSSSLHINTCQYISAAVKRNAPDLSFLRETCRSTYGYSWSAVSKIDNAVRVGVVERVNHYLPDEEAKAKIARFAKNAAVYACHEALKCLPLPGVVSIYNIVTQLLRDEKIEDYKEAMKTLQARIGRLENESNHYRKLLKEAQMLRCDNSIESQNAPCLNSNTNVNQKPDKNVHDEEICW